MLSNWSQLLADAGDAAKEFEPLPDGDGSACAGAASPARKTARSRSGRASSSWAGPE